MTASGLEIEAKDKASYASSILSRDDRLENIRGIGWIIRGVTPKAPEVQTDETEEVEIEEEAAEDQGYGAETAPPSRPMVRPRRQPSVADELDDDVPF